MTSKAVQPPSASSANSIGLGPLWPSASSITNAWPVPDWATNWRPVPSTVVKHSLPSIMAHLIFLRRWTRRPFSRGWKARPTTRALASAKATAQAFHSPQEDECNLRGEVTEKLCAGAKCDFMTELFCSEPANFPSSSSLDLCFRSDQLRHAPGPGTCPSDSDIWSTYHVWLPFFVSSP